MVIKELMDDLIGRKITCKIGGKRINEAMVVFENNSYFIVHNEKSRDGRYCRDKHGYMYSWEVYDGSRKQLEAECVTDIMLKSVIHELWI